MRYLRRVSGGRVSLDKGFRSSLKFPDPEDGTMVDGLVAVGGRLDVGTLYHAYRQGIFPWPQEGLPMLWFSPEERGVLFFDELHVPRRAKGLLKPDPGLHFAENTAFRRVVEACQRQPRPGQAGTWILPEMVDAYENFHRAGFARSFEVWRGDDLIGALYGVFVEGVFSGESMFHVEDDASKRALLFAVERLRAEGLRWIDTQMVTPVVAAFGGRLVDRAEYLEMLREEQERWRARK